MFIMLLTLLLIDIIGFGWAIQATAGGNFIQGIAMAIMVFLSGHIIWWKYQYYYKN